MSQMYMRSAVCGVGNPLRHDDVMCLYSLCLQECLLFYVPQLVQAIRYDTMGYITEFLLDAARKSQLFAHQLIWNMRTNVFRDEDSQNYDGELRTCSVMRTVRTMTVSHERVP